MNEVEEETKKFLSLHWNNEQLSNLPSTWASYNFKGPVPSGECQGCYVLIENEKVIYIGLGASRGSSIYKEHGIGTRLNSHVLSWDRSIPAEVQDRIYKPQEKWSGISEIFTFGFPSDYGYLACSLEAYLISKLEPESNVTKTSSASN